MTGPLYIAVDLGAGSGRVFLAGVDPDEFFLEEIHRFTYPPREGAGHLRWDFSMIFDQIKRGLRAAGERTREIGRPVNSIGIDSWGVDYGLLDSNGELIADPVCYRDDRTAGIMERVFEKVPRHVIFERTGIQFMNFNTLFQLYSGDGDVQNAETLLLMPDLIGYCLTGKAVAEYTNATTTQMVNAGSGNWDLDLLEKLKLPSRILPEIIPAGTRFGKLKPELAGEFGLPDVSVVAPATHDTGSAVAGAPLKENWAYISSGTWSLIGIERDKVLINAAAARENFTNEGGAYGTVRFLKNVMGLWIFESCRREWKDKGIVADYDTILREVAAIDAPRVFIFPDDERFLNPASMIAAISEQLRETGQEFENRPAFISRIIFDSLAFRYASVLRKIESLTGISIEGVQVIGGGGRNAYINQVTANASGLTVQAGPVEATVVGNVLVQAISAGRFASLAEAREHISENLSFEGFVPRFSPGIEEEARRYGEIEARFLG